MADAGRPANVRRDHSPDNAGLLRGDLGIVGIDFVIAARTITLKWPASHGRLLFVFRLQDDEALKAKSPRRQEARYGTSFQCLPLPKRSSLDGINQSSGYAGGRHKTSDVRRSRNRYKRHPVRLGPSQSHNIYPENAFG